MSGRNYTLTEMVECDKLLCDAKQLGIKIDVWEAGDA